MAPFPIDAPKAKGFATRTKLLVIYVWPIPMIHLQRYLAQILHRHRYLICSTNSPIAMIFTTKPNLVLLPNPTLRAQANSLRFGLSVLLPYSDNPLDYHHDHICAL